MASPQGSYQDYIVNFLNKPNPTTGRGFWYDKEAAQALGVAPEMIAQWRTMAQVQNPALQGQLAGQTPANIFQGIYGTQFDPANQGAIPSVVQAANPTATPTAVQRPASSVPSPVEAASAARQTAPVPVQSTMPELARFPGDTGGNPGYVDVSIGWPGWPGDTGAGLGWPGVWTPGEGTAAPTTPRPTTTTTARADQPNAGNYNPGVVNPRPTTEARNLPGTPGINPAATAPTATGLPSVARNMGNVVGLGGALAGAAIGGNGNNFTYPSGDLSKQFEGLLSGTGKALTPYLNNVGNYPFSQAGTGLNNYYASQAIPTYQNLMSGMGASQGAAGTMYNMGGNTSNLMGNWLNQIYQSGMPNQRAIEGIVNPQINTANALTGGQPGTYGYQDLLSQVMGQGLPGQNLVQQMMQNQAGAQGALQGGQPGQYGWQDLLSQVMQQGLPGQLGVTAMGNKLASQATTGGLTPEVVNAYKGLILQPQQEALQGAANRQGGGVAEVPTFDESGNLQTAGSGLFAELARRNERDFNNQLLTQGFQMTPQLAGQATNAMTGVAGAVSPYVNMAQQGGQNAVQNLLGGFTGIGSTVSPYVNMAGNFANQGVQNALSAYGIVPSSISPYFNAGAQMGTNQMSQGLQGMLQGNQNQNQAYNNLMSQILGLSGQQNQYALGQQNQQGDLLQQLLGGMFGQQNTQAMIDQQRQSQLYQAIAQAAAAIPWGTLFP